MTAFRTKRLLATALSRTVGEMSCFLRPAYGRRVVMYHAVDEPVAGDTNGIYSISKERLAQHFSTLAKDNVTPLGSSESAGTQSVSITFDDGYRSFLTAVVPLAERYGVPVHVFLAREFVLQGNPVYLSESDVVSLAHHQLVTIGVHGNRHLDLTMLGDDDVRSELSTARHWLQNLTGCEVSTLSYPFGRVDQRVARLASGLGFTEGFTSMYGMRTTSTDPMLIPRIDVWSTDTVGNLKSKLRGAWSILKESHA